MKRERENVRRRDKKLGTHQAAINIEVKREVSKTKENLERKLSAQQDSAEKDLVAVEKSKDKEISKLQKALNKLTIEVRALKQRNLDSHLKHQVKLKKEKDKMVIQVGEQVKERTQEVRRERADMHLKYKAERSEVLKLSTQFSKATDKVKKLEDEVSTLKQEKTGLNRKLLETMKQLDSTKHFRDKYESTMDKLKIVSKDLEKIKDTRNKNEETTKLEAKQATSNSKAYKEKLDEAIKIMSEFNPTLNQKDKMIQAQEGTIDNLNQKISKLQIELNQAKAKPHIPVVKRDLSLKHESDTKGGRKAIH